MNVSEAIQTKRAIRQFENKPVPQEDIFKIVNSGRRAQSSKNSQPWQFLVVQDRETLQKFSTMGTYAGHLAGAAFAVVILTPDPTSRFSVMFDAGQTADCKDKYVPFLITSIMFLDHALYGHTVEYSSAPKMIHQSG